MKKYAVLLASLAIALSAACNPFRQPVRVSNKDEALNSRWHASLASPASLAGAVQMSGSASMAPTPDGSKTTVIIALANAAPGGHHPWSVQQGECGAAADRGMFGRSEEYKTLNVTSGGGAKGEASIPLATPVTGNYFVVVRASPLNWETIVACGNLAPPTR